jgi:hypothetical protein
MSSFPEQELSAQEHLVELVRESVLNYLGPDGSWSISHEKASADDGFFYGMVANLIAKDVAVQVTGVEGVVRLRRHRIAPRSATLHIAAGSPILQDSQQPAIEFVADAEALTIDPAAIELPQGIVPVDWTEPVRSAVPADWALEGLPLKTTTQSIQIQLVA